ncbi:hypothetical protein [Pseudomonas sp. H1h]|uniref:hypothetical protein n=1 Tax=Pseudomonas sp. H1h TaxID=1397280 RepID=UPI000469201E|nr:hypothetical protein [Pseudomonas sp. H1h]
MPAIRVTAILTFAVAASAAAYSARFVGEQIEYLYEKLAPPAQNFDFATDWTPIVSPLPSLEDQLKNSSQSPASPTLVNFPLEKELIRSSH